MSDPIKTVSHLVLDYRAGHIGVNIVKKNQGGGIDGLELFDSKEVAEFAPFKADLFNERGGINITGKEERKVHVLVLSFARVAGSKRLEGVIVAFGGLELLQIHVLYIVLQHGGVLRDFAATFS
jgi:hypothetical protein